MLLQNLPGISNGLGEVGKKRRCPGAIGDAVIAANREHHYGSDGWLALQGYNPFGDCALAPAITGFFTQQLSKHAVR
jgi:hypothetical protein